MRKGFRPRYNLAVEFKVDRQFKYTDLIINELWSIIIKKNNFKFSTCHKPTIVWKYKNICLNSKMKTLRALALSNLPHGCEFSILVGNLIEKSNMENEMLQKHPKRLLHRAYRKWRNTNKRKETRSLFEVLRSTTSNVMSEC